MSFFFKKTILLCGILFCFVPFVQAEQSVGTVISLSGKAWAKAKAKKRILTLKSRIMEKDRLITGRNGRLQIIFTDASILSLAPATTVSIESFSFGETDSPNMALHIAKGITRMVSGKIVAQHPEGFKISSPLATIGIRGTITIHDVKQENEHHFVESLGKNHDVWIQGQDGNIVQLNTSLTGVNLRRGKATPTKGRPMTWKEQKNLKEALTPASEDRIPFDAEVEKEIQEKNVLREESIRTRYEPQPEPDPQPQAGPEPQPQPEPYPYPEPQPGPAPQPEPDPHPQPQPKPEPQPQPDPYPYPEPQPGPAPEPDPHPQPGSNNPTNGPDENQGGFSPTHGNGGSTGGFRPPFFPHLPELPDGGTNGPGSTGGSRPPFFNPPHLPDLPDGENGG